MRKQTLPAIITFFALAFVLSFAFSKLPNIILLSVDVRDILCGFGPLLSGLICYQVFKTPTTYSAVGTQPVKALLIVLISAVTFMFTNTKDSVINNLVFVLAQLLYCFGEEFGWRHYLQSATDHMNKWLQSLVIGVVWFCWHFSWLQDPIKTMLGENINAPFAVAVSITIAMLVLFSAFLGWIMKKTNALLLATVTHFVIKTNSITTAVTISLVVIALLTWDKIKLSKTTAAE